MDGEEEDFFLGFFIGEGLVSFINVWLLVVVVEGFGILGCCFKLCVGVGVFVFLFVFGEILCNRLFDWVLVLSFIGIGIVGGLVVLRVLVILRVLGVLVVRVGGIGVGIVVWGFGDFFIL